jgi:hypothetical protein
MAGSPTASLTAVFDPRSHSLGQEDRVAKVVHLNHKKHGHR